MGAYLCALPSRSRHSKCGVTDPWEADPHLLKVLSSGRGSEAVIEAQALAGVAGEGVGAVGAVPGVVAVGPGQLHGEGGEEVVQGPGDDDVVEEAHVQRDEDDREAHAWGGENTAAVSRAPSHLLPQETSPRLARGSPPSQTRR